MEDAISKGMKVKKMKQISNKGYEKYQHFQLDQLYGRVLTPDGMRIVCNSFERDPEKIGKHMLDAADG